MKRKRRLSNSQKVHKSLINYHKRACESAKGDSHDIHLINMHYHSKVYDIQEQTKRVLSIIEREKIYSKVVRKYY